MQEANDTGPMIANQVMDKPWGLDPANPEHRRRMTIGKTVDTAMNSLSRIHDALQLSLREEAGPLLKSDLDNAAKHANQLARHIRTIKKALFPVVDKPLPEVKTEQ